MCMVQGGGGGSSEGPRHAVQMARLSPAPVQFTGLRPLNVIQR